jgi:hypothetical protein
MKDAARNGEPFMANTNAPVRPSCAAMENGTASSTIPETPRKLKRGGDQTHSILHSPLKPFRSWMKRPIESDF